MNLRIEIKESQKKTCQRCGGGIVWLQNRYGKWYPVNDNGVVDVERRRGITTVHHFVRKMDFHSCAKELEARQRIELEAKAAKEARVQAEYQMETMVQAVRELAVPDHMITLWVRLLVTNGRNLGLGA